VLKKVKGALCYTFCTAKSGQVLIGQHLLGFYLVAFLQGYFPDACTCGRRSLLDECRMIDRISWRKQQMAHYKMKIDNCYKEKDIKKEQSLS